MSIDKVEITNSQGNLLTLSLEDISNGYVVQEIDGLDPVKASIVSSGFATIDGQEYQASSRETRNITIRLGFAPDFSVNETVRVLRSRLYPYFMPKSEVALKFYMTDGLVVNTTGRVESCEAPLFVQEPQVDISIICFDPDFIDNSMTALHSTFNLSNTSGQLVQVDGTVNTGISSLRFTSPGTLSEFTIYHTAPSGILRTMLISAPLILNDQVEICTIKGQKSITLTRGGGTSSLLWAVSPESTWIQLEPGPNQMYIHAASGSAAVLVDFYNRYGGL